MKKLFTLLSIALVCIGYAQAPADYYNGTEGLSKEALKTKLNAIISKGHRDNGYKKLYTGYITTDSDFFYEKDGSLLDIYSENPTGTENYLFQHGSKQCGEYHKEGDCYNREHIIPQSLFEKKSPMRNDIHFVVPSDGKVNGVRNNFPFGVVASPTYTSTNGSKLGKNTTQGYSETVFEPINEFKGDIARMIFYFVTRYENQLGNFKTGNILGGSAYPGIEPWQLNVLLDWHKSDPVSQREIERNNAAFAYQGNRNPYIDQPNWVGQIWGESTITPTPVVPPVPPVIIPPTGTYCAIEDFEKIPSGANSYGEQTWTNNNITWVATDARTDQSINGKAITIRNGSLTSSKISGGIKSITITTQLKFSGKADNLTLFINGKEMGTIPYSSEVKTTTIDDINITEDAIIEIKNNSSKNRVAIDDLSWTCPTQTPVNPPVDTTPPSVPTNLIINDASENSISLEWTAATDDTAVTDYDVYMNGTLQTSVSVTNAKIEGLAPDTEYQFFIKAKDAQKNESQQSNVVTGRTLKIVVPVSPTPNTPPMDFISNAIQPSIHPNPVISREFYISGLDTTKSYTVRIYSSEGSFIQRINYVNNNSKIVLNHKLPTGTYILVVGDKSIKFIVQ